MNRRPPPVSLLLLSLAPVGFFGVGCGARTGLTYEPFDAGTPPPPPPPECVVDRDCDDGVDCSEDRCVGGECSHAGRDDRCDDGLFCTGEERCDVRAGCRAAGPPCTHPVMCVERLCDERRGMCGELVLHADRCPLSHRCDETLGCVARALVFNNNALYEIDLPGGTSHRIAPLDVSLTDIALHPDGTTYGINRTALFRIDEGSGATEFVAPLAEESVALDVHPDGDLIAAGVSTVVRIDPRTGVQSFIASFPPGFSASGDIAFVRGRMLVSASRAPGASSGPPDVMVEVDYEAGTTRVLPVPVGFPCVWGLAPFGDTLYGFTCRGELLSIDVDSGRAERLTELDVLRIGGAAAR